MTKTQVAVVTALVTSLFWICAGGTIAVGSFLFYRVIAPAATRMEDFSLVNDPPPFQVQIQYPTECAAGEEIRVEGTVGNPAGETLTIDSIDVSNSFLDGFELVSFEGAAGAGTPVMDFTTFDVSRALDPGTEFPFVVRLRAKRQGVFTGDLDVCDPDQDFVTQSLSVTVHP